MHAVCPFSASGRRLVPPARAQPRFLAAFGLAPDAAPTLLVLSPRKARGARLTGAFDAAGLDALVDGLLAGRVPTEAFQARCRSGDPQTWIGLGSGLRVGPDRLHERSRDAPPGGCPCHDRAALPGRAGAAWESY